MSTYKSSSEALDAVLQALDSSNAAPSPRLQAQEFWEKAFLSACAGSPVVATKTVSHAEEVANLAVLVWARRWACE